MKLERGLAVARSGHAQQISMKALGLLIRSSGAATYQVTVEGNSILVASQQGNIHVQGANRAALVPSGKAMRFVLVANTTTGRTGRGANNLNETVVWIVLVATAVAIGTGFAIANDNDQPVSPSSP